jgi:hypothetical protein
MLNVRVLLVSLVGVAVGSPPVLDHKHPPPCWEHDVKPLMQARCVSCHNPSNEDLSSYSSDSIKVFGIIRETKLKYMPPRPAAPVPDSVVRMLEAWRDQGVPRCPDLPKVKKRRTKTKQKTS